jgi:hypothetical protein
MRRITAKSGGAALIAEAATKPQLIVAVGQSVDRHYQEHGRLLQSTLFAMADQEQPAV